MSGKKKGKGQFDLFVPYITDLAIRDQRETMERPFFSLAKRKRLKPIDYRSPDGSTVVTVHPHQDFGMATIWDADILIWAASTLQTLKNENKNDLPRTLHFHPYNLLTAIGRGTGGDSYDRLVNALGRLQTTVISTNIRAQGDTELRQFSWIEGWEERRSGDGKHSKGMRMTLSKWVYEGILMDGGLLAINPDYFAIKGGRERWLYRVARKHAGQSKSGRPFRISLPVLFEKSGAEGTYRAFKHFINKTVISNGLPDYELALERTEGQGEPVLNIVRRAPEKTREQVNHELGVTRGKQGQLSEKALNQIRRDFPGWDLYALKDTFDAWLEKKTGYQPDNYEAAFYGFVKRHDAQSKKG